jgi:hypothetical protein
VAISSALRGDNSMSAFTGTGGAGVDVSEDVAASGATAGAVERVDGGTTG